MRALAINGHGDNEAGAGLQMVGLGHLRSI